MQTAKTAQPFSGYQVLMMILLALIQFTVVLDFMVMAPLGDLLMKRMHLTPLQFATAVSAYAFSAGASGLLAAGFADKYDRKSLLLFFYIGFIAGTLICAIAPTYPILLAGRIITGIFGGVLASVSMAIIADLFTFDQRGRVMGIVQMSFAVSQVAGIPVGLLLANRFGWGAPFYLIVGISVVIAVLTFLRMRPVNEHLKQPGDRRPLQHLLHTISTRRYLLPFLNTALLSIGGFLIMPFAAPFTINNLGIDQDHLPLLYMITGLGTFVILPLVGFVTDKAGKFPTFVVGSILAMIMVYVYTNLTPIPLWELVLVNTVMFAGIMSRMIPAQAINTAIPQTADRGAFMAINSSLQQIAGGIAAALSGLIIVVEPSGKLLHFDLLGYLCIGVMVVCGFLMYRINQAAQQRAAKESADVTVSMAH